MFMGRLLFVYLCVYRVYTTECVHLGVWVRASVYAHEEKKKVSCSIILFETGFLTEPRIQHFFLKDEVYDQWVPVIICLHLPCPVQGWQVYLAMSGF